jgi:hypothetical protein
MKALLKCGDSVTLEVEGGNQVELFENLSSTQEVFGVDKCGACGNKQFRFAVRKVTKMEGKKAKEFKYYEFHCTSPKCRARLAFGQHQEGGTLFPRRKDGEKYLPNNGWTVYQKEDSDKSEE